jgi:hypothetical protein
MPDFQQSEGRGALDGARGRERSTPQDLIDYFDRAFVINLPARTDRRREMQRELRRVDFLDRPHKLEFFPAWRVDDAAGFASPGARGRFVSHLEILRRALRTGLSRVLVMEDDLAISPHLLIVQSRLVERLACDDWDFAYFGHAGARSEREGLLVPYDGWLAKTHFYAVRGRVIGQLVGFLEELSARLASDPDPAGGSMELDRIYQIYRERNPETVTLLAQPNLGTQRCTRSDIHPAWWDQLPVLRQAASGLRWMRRQTFST